MHESGCVSAPPPFSLRLAFADILDAFRERAFMIFAIGALAAYIGQGVSLSITLYVIRYVWQFSELAFKIYPVALGVSVMAMFFLVGPLHRRFGKPVTGARASLATLAIAGTPYVLFLAGLWPQTGTALSTVLFIAFTVTANTAGVIAIISATSMVAEIVEAFEERFELGLDCSGHFGITDQLHVSPLVLFANFNFFSIGYQFLSLDLTKVIKLIRKI